MGRFLFFWILLLQLNLAWSQVFSFTEHRRVDYVSQLAHINNRCFYLELVDYSSPYYTGMSAEELYLVGVADSAKPFLRKKLLNQANAGDVTYPYYSSRRILKATHDKHLLCYFESRSACDLTGGIKYLTKLDTNGNSVFTVTTSIVPADMLQYTDSSYYLIGGATLSHHSKNGAFLSNHTFSGANYYSISLLNNGNLLLSSPTSFSEVDTAGNSIQVAVAPSWLKKFVQTGSGTGFGLTSGKMIRCTATYSITNESQLPGITLNDFYYQNDSIFVVGRHNATQKPYYAIVNSSLIPIYQTNTSQSGLLPMSIEISNNQTVNILGYSSAANSFRGRTFVKMPKLGNFQLQHDIAVVSYTATSLSAGLGMFSYNGEFKVSVKNNSNFQVKGFNLNVDYPGMICPKSWQMWFDTIIHPNASAVVNTGNIMVYGSTGASQNVTICFFTSAPGRQPDIQVANDAFCSSTPVLVGVSETMDKENQLQIFPNPFNSSFNIESEFEIKEVRLFNALGEMVLNQIATGKEVSIEIPDFSKGIYFLSIETEKGTVTKKLIKD
ncbi:MAG: T9SS type A sorting domain-containing protein [Bacteroidia bacterium]|jgi:hypothetical protein|nr:T9SS type A sorting domain-containing protein [Bacteroidia bacterium]